MIPHRASILCAALIANLARGTFAAACTGTATNICVSVDLHAGETGYYNLDRGSSATTTGSSPDITVNIGDVITFDQTHATNWYHPIGFAYYPDGAHGADWGGAERAEIERSGELQYKIDGVNPSCTDAGDTGLDCYEPEFFFPRKEWSAKLYKAELTITQAVCDDSQGGVVYYFCHIHSKMSGKIKINGCNGVTGSSELALYSPTTNNAFDTKCGTTGTSEYAASGTKACNLQFFGGTHDTDYEKCLQAIDCQMHRDMYAVTSADDDSKIVTFMQQMIPHHQNAVNMAKLLLKQATANEIAAVEDLEGILHNIINTQNFQIHTFRNYLNGLSPSKLKASDDSVPSNAITSPALILVSTIMATFMILG